MANNNINYQQIFEQELNHTVRDNAGMTERFYELPHEQRMFVEGLIDVAYNQAVVDALDTDVLTETTELAAEMGTQLYNFANMLSAYLSPKDDTEEN